jgi:hypothetical protein
MDAIRIAALTMSGRCGISHAATAASGGPSRVSVDGGAIRRTTATAASAAAIASSKPLTPLVPASSPIARSTASTEHAAMCPAVSRPNFRSSGRGSRCQTRAAAIGITATSITASRNPVRDRETGTGTTWSLRTR